MKYAHIILFIFSFIFSQDRTVIFNTGSPEDLQSGHLISNSQSVANRFTVQNNYVLEAMVFYMHAEEGNNNVVSWLIGCLVVLRLFLESQIRP